MEVSVKQNIENNIRKSTLKWNSGYAGDAPIKKYEIWRDGSMIKEIPFLVQIADDSFTYSESLNDNKEHSYSMKVVDAKGRIAESMPVILDKMG